MGVEDTGGLGRLLYTIGRLLMRVLLSETLDREAVKYRTGSHQYTRSDIADLFHFKLHRELSCQDVG